MNNLINVIVPVFNGASFIREAIESILLQTYQPIHIIVANDGSTDNSAEIIRELTQENNNITLLDLPHRGSASTLNSALALISAEFIAFLDCDDLWHKEKIAKQFELLSNNPTLDICFTQLTEFNDRSNIQQIHSARAQTMNGVSKTSLLCRASVFKNAGLFNAEIEMGEFVEWFGRCQILKIRYETIAEVLTFRRVHANNMSKNASASDYLKLLHQHLQHKESQKIRG